MAAHSSFKHKPAALLRFQVIKHESPDEPDRSSILQIPKKKHQEGKFSTGVGRESERCTAERPESFFYSARGGCRQWFFWEGLARWSLPLVQRLGLCLVAWCEERNWFVDVCVFVFSSVERISRGREKGGGAGGERERWLWAVTHKAHGASLIVWRSSAGSQRFSVRTHEARGFAPTSCTTWVQADAEERRTAHTRRDGACTAAPSKYTHNKLE